MTADLRQECADCGFIYDPADYGGVSLFYLDDWECGSSKLTGQSRGSESDAGPLGAGAVEAYPAS